jgi:hypothetical protein
MSKYGVSQVRTKFAALNIINISIDYVHLKFVSLLIYHTSSVMWCLIYKLHYCGAVSNHVPYYMM